MNQNRQVDRYEPIEINRYKQTERERERERDRYEPK